MKKPDLRLCRQSFEQAMEAAEKLVRAANGETEADIYGFVFVLLFASYEHLLHSLALELFETAASYRGKLSNLSSAFIVAGIWNEVKGVIDSGRKTRTTEKATSLADAFYKYAKNINTRYFPDDGSFMKQSQITAFCKFFNLDSAAPLLGKAWDLVPEVVSKRNEIAHGTLSPRAAAGNCTKLEMIDKVKMWKDGWISFIDAAEIKVNERDYFIR